MPFFFSLKVENSSFLNLISLINPTLSLFYIALPTPYNSLICTEYLKTVAKLLSFLWLSFNFMLHHTNQRNGLHLPQKFRSETTLQNHVQVHLSRRKKMRWRKLKRYFREDASCVILFFKYFTYRDMTRCDIYVLQQHVYEMSPIFHIKIFHQSKKTFIMSGFLLCRAKEMSLMWRI